MDLPDPGTEPKSPALQADSLPLRHWGSPQEEGMAPHSSILAWGLPKTEQLGRLQQCWQRPKHDGSDWAQYSGSGDGEKGTPDTA